MSTSLKIGFIVGAIIGIAIVAIVLACRKEKWVYDERQQLARGKAFKYGYITLGTTLFVLSFVQELLLPELFGTFMLELCSLFISLCVFACVCIANDAYLALNERPRKVILIAVVAGLLNVAIGLVNALSNRSMQEPVILPLSCVNLLCAAMVFIIVIVFSVHMAKIKKAEALGNEESST